MRKLCVSLLTSVLFILVFSCAPVRQEAISTADVVGLDETRAWFEATHQQNGSARSDGRDAAYLADVKIAWEKGKRVETKNSQGFSIPLSHNRVMWGDGDQFTDVPPLQLVVMEKNGERYAFLVVLQPDDLKNWSKDPKTFTGKVRLLDWEGHPVKGWIVKNGVIKGRIFTGAAAGKSRNGRSCMDFNEDTYECVYQGNWDCKKPNPDGVVVYSMTETRSANQTCSQTIYENCKKYVLQEENLVSSDVTTVCDTEEEADLYGFMTFEQYTNTNPGFTGNSGTPVVTINIMQIANRKITIDPSVTGCNRELIEKIVNDKTTRDRIVDVFASYFREGTADIKFIQVNEPGGDHAAYNEGPPQVIKVNSAYPESTKEFMTAVILHEMVHSLIIMTTTNPVPPQQLEMHRSMFFNWVDKVATTMRTYYPQLNDDEARAFGLIGLDDYVQTDRTRIDQLATEKYGMTTQQAVSKILPYMSTQKGTRCN